MIVEYHWSWNYSDNNSFQVITYNLSWPRFSKMIRFLADIVGIFHVNISYYMQLILQEGLKALNRSPE